MIALVNWQYVILNGSAANGYRVKRRTGGPPPVFDGRTDAVNADFWNSQPAPGTILYQGQQYIFAFWSITGQDMLSLQRESHLDSGKVAGSSHPGPAAMGGGQWIITAKAFYVWDFGRGPGAHAILLDAFDVQAGDFLADDFVDAIPATLTADANNGYINTTTQIPAGQVVKITARDALYPNKTFAYWLEVASLTHTGDPGAGPPTIGFPGLRDIVAHPNDIVVAFGVYNSTTLPLRINPHYEIYDPWWYFKTHGGLTPPLPIDPTGPWLGEFAAALALAQASNKISPRLRASLLRVALEQVGIASASLKKEIKQLGEK